MKIGLGAHKILSIIFLLTGILAATNFFGEVETPVENNSNANLILLAEIKGTIDPATAGYLKKAIKRAEKQNAKALLVELDTPGGLVTSVREMAQSVSTSKVPIIIYVTPAGASATSAGALLSLSAHVAAMAPGTNIGAAHPVSGDGKEMSDTMSEKATNDVAAFARGLAELRGRNIQLAQDVVSKSKSFTAQEALKENLIELIAPTRLELLNKLHNREIKLNGVKDTVTIKLQTQNAVIEPIQMSLGQKILHLLAHPNIATLLMSLGVLLIYIEITSPGIGWAGVGGAIALIIAFIALQLLPVRTGGLVLIGLGIILMIAEPFITSGGALAGGGVLAFVLGLLWVMDPEQTSLRVDTIVWLPSALVLGGGALFVGWAAARTKLLSKKAREKIAGEGPAGLMGYNGLVLSVKDDFLRGKVQIRGEIWSFVSVEPVKKGDSVDVLTVDGMIVKVKKSLSKREDN